MKAKAIDLTDTQKNEAIKANNHGVVPVIINRLPSQFPDTVPAMGQHHDGSDINSLVAKQKQRDREKSKQSLINDILKGTFEPAYSKKDPADLSKALQQVKARLDNKSMAFRKVKQANTLLVYSMDGTLIESVDLNRRGYYSESIRYWFARSQSLSEIAAKYTEISDQPVFCKRIAINNYHYKQYVIVENIANAITDSIDGVTVFKTFSILASGTILADENDQPITLHSLDTAKEFLKSL